MGETQTYREYNITQVKRMYMSYFIFKVSRTKDSTSDTNKCIVGIYIRTRVPPLAVLPKPSATADLPLYDPISTATARRLNCSA